jgi:hypothetical protein
VPVVITIKFCFLTCEGRAGEIAEEAVNTPGLGTVTRHRGIIIIVRGFQINKIKKDLSHFR